MYMYVLNNAVCACMSSVVYCGSTWVYLICMYTYVRVHVLKGKLAVEKSSILSHAYRLPLMCVNCYPIARSIAHSIDRVRASLPA